jgi:cyclopropane fatty-acyl-phospholipid synthase-like methyltransferase
MNSRSVDFATCRLCGSAANAVALKLSGMPRWNHRLLEESEVATDRAVDLEIHRCGSCGFVSLPLQLQDDYYDDYVNAPSQSPQMQQFQRAQAHDFVERFGLRGKSVLEVGCGDGFFLDMLRAEGVECTGIEPSEAQRAIALARELRVEGGLLTADRRLPTGPFDAFATRQVFEHVPDPAAFLAAIRANLKPQAVGLVEVPNLDALIDESRFFDFIPEHLN